jgi:hypothetical protein
MKPVMDCREARAHAPLFVGEDLESDALEAVRGHVEACAECAAQVAALERALRAFEVERVRVDPRVDLWSNIERELAHSGHLRPAQAASKSLVASNVGPVAVPLPTTAASAAGVTNAAVTTEATAAPMLAPRRTLAGARRWFAVAAAAAIAAFVVNGWLVRESGRSDSPSGAQSGPGATGPQVVRNAQPTPSSPSGSAAGAAHTSTGAQGSLVANVSRPSHESAGQGFRLVATGTSAPAPAPAGLGAAGSAASGLAPADVSAPARYEGLRRVNGDEALLRESLDRWGVQGGQGGYSLVGYPVTR